MQEGKPTTTTQEFLIQNQMEKRQMTDNAKNDQVNFDNLDIVLQQGVKYKDMGNSPMSSGSNFNYMKQENMLNSKHYIKEEI